MAAAILACAIASIGLGVSLYAGAQARTEAEAAWLRAAQSDAARLTRVVDLQLAQSRRLLGAVSAQLGVGARSATVAAGLRMQSNRDGLLEPFWLAMLRGTDAAGATGLRHVSSAPMSRLGDGVTTDGAALIDPARLSAALDIAMRRGGTAISESWDASDPQIRAPIAALVAVPPDRAEPRRQALAALFVPAAFIERVLSEFGPDGLLLRVVQETPAGSEVALFGPADPATGSMTVATERLGGYGEVGWRLAWDVLPSYNGGPSDARAVAWWWAGSLTSILFGVLVGWIVFQRGLREGAVRRRTAELDSARRQAEIANRAKSDLLANMSHELRTPLNSIIGFSEVMEDQIRGPESWESYRTYATDIRQSGRHLLSLINDILDLSKAESGYLAIEDAYICPTALIESAVRLVHERARNKGLTLETSTIEGLPLLRCDERRVKQILLNLLSNAIKFTPAGGRVEIGVRHGPEGGLDLWVRDTGIGMERGQIPMAMAKFRQLGEGQLGEEGGQADDDPDKVGGGGTGLGLPLAATLAKLHGAELILDSAPGQGTLATVRFGADRSGREEDVLTAGRGSA